MFTYEQLRTGSNLFYIKGEFKATGIQQVPEATLTQYNADNDTDFDVESQEFLKIPLMGFPDVYSIIDSKSNHLWIPDSGPQIDWLEPLKIVIVPDSNLLEMKYDEEDGRYPVVFGSNLTWNVHMKFSDVVELYMPSENESVI